MTSPDNTLNLDALDDFDSFDFSFDDFDEEASSQEAQDDGRHDERRPDAAGLFLPNTEGRTEFLPPDPDRVPQIPDMVDRSSPTYAQRSAKERTHGLMSDMAPHRRVLLGVLAAALEPKSTSELTDRIDELRAHKFSVYSQTNICTMLESAGALSRVMADGTPVQDFRPEPKIVVVDGEEYWEPTRMPEPYWQTSEAGKEELEANRPCERLARQFDREQEFLCLYKRILLLCDTDEGATMKTVSSAVDSDPLVDVEPRRFYAQHFLEALERCEAVEWQGTAWKTTSVGKSALENELSEIQDHDYVMGRPVVPEGIVPPV